MALSFQGFKSRLISCLRSSSPPSLNRRRSFKNPVLTPGLGVLFAYSCQGDVASGFYPFDIFA